MEFPTFYQLDQSISVLRLLSGNFHFHSNFKSTLCMKTVETLSGRHVLSRLIWVCTVCLCPTERTLG